MLALVIGGAASGKSEYAEQLAVKLHAQSGGELCYLAAMLPWGQEAEARIAKHRQARAGKGFSTMECYLSLKTCEVPSGSTLLLECMSNLLANEMYEEDGAGAHAVEEILQGIDLLQKKVENIVIVSNQIDLDGVPYESSTMEYLANLSAINCEIARKAQSVTEVVCTFPLAVKGVTL